MDAPLHHVVINIETLSRICVMIILLRRCDWVIGCFTRPGSTTMCTKSITVLHISSDAPYQSSNEFVASHHASTIIEIEDYYYQFALDDDLVIRFLCKSAVARKTKRLHTFRHVFAVPFLFYINFVCQNR